MNRAVLAVVALLALALVALALAPWVYHGVFCSFCRRMRALRRAVR